MVHKSTLRHEIPVLLLVEDNTDDVLLTQRALKKSNIMNPVVVASDGQEALDYVFHEGKYSDRNPEEYPVAVLLDLNLPKVTGMEVLERIRHNEKTQQLPIVILTSSRQEEDINLSYKLGANSFIQKSINFEEFTNAINQLVAMLAGTKQESKFESPKVMSTPLRVLLIEDNKDDAILLLRALRRSGFEPDCLQIQSAEEMSRALEEAAWDIVITDYSLPQFSAPEAVALLQKTNPDIPCIVVSGIMGEDTAVELMKAGAGDYILKEKLARLGPAIERELREAKIRKERRRVIEEREYLLQEREIHLSQLHAVITNMTEALIIFDTSGNIHSMNPAALRIYGYDSIEEARRHESDFIHSSQYDMFYLEGTEVPHLRQPLPRIFQGETFSNYEIQVRRKDTGSYWIGNFGGTAVRNSSGDIVLAVLTLRDVTSQKEQERYLHNLNTYLQDLNKLLEHRVKERTQSLIRHQEHLQYLASELTLTEQRERRRLACELHDYLAQMLIVCRMRLQRFIKSNTETPNLSILENLDEMLEKSTQYTRTLIAQLSPTILYESGLLMALQWLANQMQQHSLHVTVEQPAEEVTLSENQSVLVFEAIRELLMNVVKHAHVDQAVITVVKEDDTALKISVSDKGVGFKTPITEAEATPARHFGLFSIRERLEALNGNLFIHSEPGQGTKAVITVPLHPVEFIEDKETVDLSECFIHTGHYPPVVRDNVVRILLVDDHTLVREGLRNIIESFADMQVVGEANNGEEAIVAARTLRPDAILMDVNMPKKNGIEATRQIKQENPSITVIGLSVNDDELISSSMREAGASFYLTKGCPSDDLYQVLCSVKKISIPAR